MNYKEALEEVKYQLINAGDYDDVYWDCVPVKILQTCKEALEKQILQKVKKVRHETILGYAETYFCPKCGGYVWKNTDECKYCFRCGQAIDWEANNGEML